MVIVLIINRDLWRKALTKCFTYPWITLQRYFLSTPSIESYFLLTTKEWNNEGLIRMQPKAWLNFCLKISLASPTFSSGWKVCTEKPKKSIRYLEIFKTKILTGICIFHRIHGHFVFWKGLRLLHCVMTKCELASQWMTTNCANGTHKKSFSEK